MDAHASPLDFYRRKRKNKCLKKALFRQRVGDREVTRRRETLAQVRYGTDVLTD